ncbi:methylenetetrahydrofolate reductase [NAD(P)H] [Caulobacter sp. S45]|uniref:methylenetetrahydrofolate reductase [NAD(P)H] n=1 Tax=Caulobacter sp. S45 TaxID=1641861 RepID=UPI00131B4417|nr:methylenetetrahydrofolate reductase [NAD(P)H] [Caulobacter sp. S45]
MDVQPDAAPARPTTDRRPRVSFEFFPPKTAELETQLWRAVDRLAPLGPTFVSVTYGAGGSTRERTLGVLKRMLAETPLRPAAHLTCVAAAREEVDQVVRDYWEAGVRHIVALRGDPPGQLGGAYEPGPECYRNAGELTAAIARIAPFEISVAAYPEKHPESPSILQDIDVLKAKVDAGATRAITQFFLDTEAFFRFVDRVRKAGISIPIVPGVMPVTSVKGLKRMAEISHARIPERVAKVFDGLDADPETRSLVSATMASELCKELVSNGFSELHFYTLNRAELVYAVCRMLGVTAPPVEAAA